MSPVKKGLPISFEGFPEDEVYTDAYFGRVAHIVKGFSRVGYCNVAYEHKTAPCGGLGRA